MTKHKFCVAKIEGGVRLTGDTLEKPSYPKTKHKGYLALMREMERLAKNADAVAVTVEVYKDPSHD